MCLTFWFWIGNVTMRGQRRERFDVGGSGRCPRLSLRFFSSESQRLENESMASTSSVVPASKFGSELSRILSIRFMHHNVYVLAIVRALILATWFAWKHYCWNNAIKDSKRVSFTRQVSNKPNIVDFAPCRFYLLHPLRTKME